MTDTQYLNAIKTYATLINSGKRTVDTVPTVYIVGCAQGIINGSYTIDDVPEVLQEVVQARVDAWFTAEALKPQSEEI